LPVQIPVVKIACIEPGFLDGLQKNDLHQQSGQHQLVKKERWLAGMEEYPSV
jgi:hypothetical protein